MKLLISNQHGAIVMALMPFLYGMLLNHPIWQHFFFLLAWFSLYLMTYPFLNLFKGRNLALYIKWSWIYFFATLIFAIPVLLHNWRTVFFVAAMTPLVLVSIYYVKKKDERAFLNDLVGIIIFAIAGMGSYYFPDRTFDSNIWLVALYPSLFFIGTTLYVKSVMRERKNPLYLKLSIGFHVLCALGFILLQQYFMALAFIPPLIRAIWLPRKKMSVKQVGLTEMAVSLLFFANLLYATL
ncbi:YwiC-like family protein [Aggregatibacter kilianii]|uniref:YwiC-like family protein n=1 Tax=Aggregatibacter kilianii TaxID=2025884 RepID=UPI000D64B451|nr:YwiC-like family protein [Aggregatibacter kilianii]